MFARVTHISYKKKLTGSQTIPYRQQLCHEQFSFTFLQKHSIFPRLNSFS